uniref:AlNc14C23G2350 protein n=1 Tax=Albugo laibachii Nc14 TaxID=890382 RepID=F0W650_9STRA|nr:AlNc14C23G2350 [Albugo laibachii Nc14]|eukprot:CCA16592.1 AlNc14C23G2350 [Albugo laibachii Nc14]
MGKLRGDQRCGLVTFRIFDFAFLGRVGRMTQAAFPQAFDSIGAFGLDERLDFFPLLIEYSVENVCAIDGELPYHLYWEASKRACNWWFYSIQRASQ